MLGTRWDWSGKKILITGHTGFKGSWLTHLLDVLGARVFGYSLDPEASSPYEVMKCGSVCEAECFGDIRDRPKLLEFVARARPDGIFHMAAQPLVRLSYNQPKETYDVNVMGSLNLFDVIVEVMVSGGLRCGLINVTTDKVYENNEWVWPYRESDALGGYDPYSSSKACAEILTASYGRSFFSASGVSAATARAGNVIGGGDFSSDRIVPDAFRALFDDSSLNVRNLQAIRPFQHVLEPLIGYISLMERLWSADGGFVGSWNFGPDVTECLSVRDLIREIEVVSGSELSLIEASSALHEAGVLKLDSSKAFSDLGWRGIYSRSEMIRVTYDWYVNAHEGADMADFTKAQVLQYIDSINER